MDGVFLEWLLCSSHGYVKRIVPLAAFAHRISCEEAQHQSIYSDAEVGDGDYGDMQPEIGLAAARTTALLTHRRKDSFENQFGRKPQPPPSVVNGLGAAALTPPESPKPLLEDDSLALVANSEGHPNTTSQSTSLPLVSTPPHARECHPNNQSSQPNPTSATNTPNS
jgi:homoserine O-acetyltransferase/O-succinyltransferase